MPDVTTPCHASARAAHTDRRIEQRVRGGGPLARVYASVEVAAPVEAVFDYVTTPTNAPRWHPSSVAVSGAVDHSLEQGERFTEELRLIAGRRVHARWTVVERIFPTKWVIEGTLAGAWRGTITCTFRAQEHSTFFEREFAYTMTSQLWALLDWLVLRYRIEAEAKQAVRQLQKAFPSQARQGS